MTEKYEALQAALEMAKPDTERLIAAIAEIPDPVDLLHRIDLVAALTACSCNLHQVSDVRQHHQICRYRMLCESAMVLRSLIRGC